MIHCSEENIYVPIQKPQHSTQSGTSPLNVSVLATRNNNDDKRLHLVTVIYKRLKRELQTPTHF